MSALTDRLAKTKTETTEDRIARLLATGKFRDTGAIFTPEQATADAANPALRWTAAEPTRAREIDGKIG